MTEAEPLPGPLPCGTEPHLLLAGAADDDETAVDPAHVAACPHCQAALADLTPRLAALRAVTDESPEVPPRVEQRVHAAIRTLRTGRTLALASRGGTLTVSADVVADVVRAAVQAIDGLRSVRVNATGQRADGRPDLELLVVVTAERAVPDLAAEIRSTVLDTTQLQLGLGAGRVDIRVTDIVL